MKSKAPDNLVLAHIVIPVKTGIQLHARNPGFPIGVGNDRLRLPVLKTKSPVIARREWPDVAISSNATRLP